ncbi:Rtg2p [Sugiyamaella lignohabitans]|uniref:Rtg2p n=1 Tax=Sugiyamaella lignohabitans TaxID=796027 RepID=A0A167F8W2_9ASCO|nr:Rtg2p [Sugiyamaella lignohabitans]ANB14972.1 Rtg2p [Sugiyamaella lignohabitans]
MSHSLDSSGSGNLRLGSQRFETDSKEEVAKGSIGSGLNNTDTSPHSNLRAIVDIGSNGIRFSISSVDPARARVFPCVFQDRAAISLFDSLHSSPPSVLESNDEDPSEEPPSVDVTLAGASAAAAAAVDSFPTAASSSVKNNISPATILEVKNALIRFKKICHDFGVPDSDVRVIATEATREAPNSVQFRQELKDATGWEVLLLSKQEEGRTGAYGVASSFFEIHGLFMDIGGGSVQLSWISCKEGKFLMSDTPVSLPYGAAALTRRLQREPRESVRQEIAKNIASAVEHIAIPSHLTEAAKKTGGFKLYVCGGGFRGLGHLLLSTHHVQPYPLPIINGFSCTGIDIAKLVSLDSNDTTVATTSSGANKVFRVSERRANQLPAVALLVSQALEVLPAIRKVLFSQGGVREGALFHDLPSSIRSQDPLLVATSPYAPGLCHRYVEILQGGFTSTTPYVIRNRIAKALVNVSFIHSSYPKELQPNAGLNICITGVVSGTHGLSHEVRALLGLALCQRWGGELPDRRLKDALLSILSARKLAWWAIYTGHLMHVIGGVYPGGNVRDRIMSLRTENVTDKGFTLILNVVADDVRANAIMVRGRINGLEKKLKKLSKDLGSANSHKVNVIVNWV